MEEQQPISADELTTRLQRAHDFENLTFPADLILDELDFTDRSFTRCRFEATGVRSASFTGGRFKDCTFLPCRFANCNFVEAKFDDCSFFWPEKKEGCTFAFGEMRNLELAHCNLSSAVLDRCDLYNLNARDCSFRSARLKSSVFHKKVSRSVVLTKARFENCNLSFADMCGLSLHSCEFPGCKFSETLLFDADFTDALLENAVIDRAEWDRAKLAGADLRGASISGLNLALLADYRGMMVSESQQDGLLEALGVKVWPG